MGTFVVCLLCAAVGLCTAAFDAIGCCGGLSRASNVLREAVRATHSGCAHNAGCGQWSCCAWCVLVVSAGFSVCGDVPVKGLTEASKGAGGGWWLSLYQARSPHSVPVHACKTEGVVGVGVICTQAMLTCGEIKAWHHKQAACR